MKTWIDEGPKNYIAGEYTATRGDIGEIDISIIKDLSGECGEHLLFAHCPTGRMTQAEWDEHKADLTENGMTEAIFVIKEKDGRVHISEGNHRLRAALELGWTKVPVEIRYFGNSQREGLVA